ncbi:glutathione S-transferase 1-like [Diabrotica undecimpunctata]|uniref:glutathione S-transferase 1-like n=1 Tax=Diabrotica undecimpunctata TaxID=50387 RepID=UPI003B6388C6
MENEGVVPLNTKTFDPKMAQSIDIYYFTMSPPSRSVLMLMRTLGIKPNIKIVNVLNGEQMKPEFLKINPLHTIPTINDNGFILYESSAILKYLVDQYGKDDSLYPRDSKKGAIVTQQLSFANTTLFPRFISTHIALLFGGSVSEDDKKKLNDALEYLNNTLSDSKWTAGENMTVADFAMIGILSNLEAAGVYDLTSFTNLWQWYERMKTSLSSYGYEDIMQAGADAFGHMIKNKINS